MTDPFAELKELVGPTKTIKIWDYELEAVDAQKMGRIRIVAVCPRTGPLINIPFSIAFCNPEDLRKYRKDLANRITVGRLMKYLKYSEEDRLTLTPTKVDSSVIRNCGTVRNIDNWKNFTEEALLEVGEIPQWVYAGQFDDMYLQSRITLNNNPEMSLDNYLDPYSQIE